VQGSLESGSSIGAAWQVSQSLVEAALNGASASDLVAQFGRILNAAGLDVSMIEIACDAVDPERDERFIRWRRNPDRTESDILSNQIFQNMLKEGATARRLDKRDEFHPFAQKGATDGIAFVTHLAPDATLGFFDDVMGLFVTERRGGFSAVAVDLLDRVTPVFALALGARLNAAAARVLLQTYLGGNAATALLGGRVGLGEVEQIRAVVIYCDLFGFTALTESLEPRLLIENLNLFFETMSRPAIGAGGQVSGHVGDAVVMFFPIPGREDERAICATAINAALEGLKALTLLNVRNAGVAAVPLRARVGVDIGEVVHGNIGSAGRFSFTIIGTPVNRAARLQALAKDLDAVLLMTSELAESAGVQGHAFGKHALRGFDRSVDIVGLHVTDDQSQRNKRLRSGSL
jgi:class 3 adenylate cyclase